MPPSTGAAIGRMISDPVPVAHSIGASPTMVVSFGKQLGTRAMDGTVHHGLAEFGKRHVFEAAAIFDGLAQVDQHHETVLGGQAKAGDVARPRPRR